jgi:Fe-S cluster biosynthesis and repair protein YggX
LQWLQDQSEINGDKFNNIRCEARRYFRNKMREYLKGKMDELATNGKNRNPVQKNKLIEEVLPT